jgi:hypothetical protein
MYWILIHIFSFSLLTKKKRVLFEFKIYHHRRRRRKTNICDEWDNIQQTTSTPRWIFEKMTSVCWSVDGMVWNFCQLTESMTIMTKIIHLTLTSRTAKWSLCHARLRLPLDFSIQNERIWFDYEFNDKIIITVWNHIFITYIMCVTYIISSSSLLHPISHQFS